MRHQRVTARPHIRYQAPWRLIPGEENRPLMRIIIALLLAAPLALAQTPEEQPEYALVELLGGKSQLLDIHGAVIDSMVLTDPELEKYRDVIDRWVAQTLSWEAVREEMAAIYRRYFTSEELSEMLAFYDSATGRKAVLLTPALIKEGSLVGASLAAEHKQQLIDMLRQARDQQPTP